MPTFYFHLATPGHLIVDEEGRNLSGLDAARQEAIASAREIIEDSAREGADVQGYAFNVTDEHGEQVMVYDFKNLMNGGTSAESAPPA
jgi:hypothetical protein